MHPFISQKRADIALICARHLILRLEVFGSAVRGADFDPATSDADFLVEFQPGVRDGLNDYFSLKDEPESVLGRGVDLVVPRAVRNPYLLAGINSAREVVHAA